MNANKASPYFHRPFFDILVDKQNDYRLPHSFGLCFGNKEMISCRKV